MLNRILSLLVVAALWTNPFIYPMALIVTDNTEVLTLENANGEVFTVDDPECWEVGELAVAIMWSGLTSDIHDDQIIRMGPANFKVFEISKEETP